MITNRSFADIKQGNEEPKCFCYCGHFCRILQFICCAVSPSLLFSSAVAHFASFIPSPSAFCSLSSHLFRSLRPDFANCIVLSVSVQLCYPTQTVSSPSVFLPPNLLFVRRCLQHSLVMFFFLRSHFRTSEGDQERNWPPKNLLQCAANSETCRPSSSPSARHNLLVAAHAFSFHLLMRQPWVNCHRHPLTTL